MIYSIWWQQRHGLLEAYGYHFVPCASPQGKHALQVILHFAIANTSTMHSSYFHPSISSMSECPLSVHDVSMQRRLVRSPFFGRRRQAKTSPTPGADLFSRVRSAAYRTTDHKSHNRMCITSPISYLNGRCSTTETQSRDGDFRSLYITLVQSVQFNVQSRGAECVAPANGGCARPLPAVLGKCGRRPDFPGI